MFHKNLVVGFVSFILKQFIIFKRNFGLRCSLEVRERRSFEKKEFFGNLFAENPEVYVWC